ncbi:MAG: hypothetical protein II649_08220 [Kiritimatiellae bacterium]|nr:hypothetical protein [Kiritimatiellia bacterium]
MATENRRQAARKFVEHWTFRRGSEKGEDQQFWNSLLGDVLGMEDVASRVQYQLPVPMKGTTKFLDGWIPETRVLIEHKSRGVNLDAPQPGHGGLTPYEQAAEYDAARPFGEKARWIVTCNFDEFRVYDRAKPLAPPMKVRLGDLPNEAHRLAFLVDPKEKAVDRELEISVQAGRIVGDIYDALLEQYEGGRVSPRAAAGEDARPPDRLAALNRLCVRLVFCLYAEDAGIFPKDCFRRLVESTPAPFLRERLMRLFQTLDTPPDKRSAYLEPELRDFPYTNGGLFRNAAETDIPPLTEELRKLLAGASRFDWRDITPTVFGALFESTLNPATRRAGGMVYTSVENIHKVIDPLFLDDLTCRVDEATKAKLSAKSRSSLLSLQSLLASLTFLDPACGSGNFLTETYICLRRLENRIIAALQQGQGELDLGISVKVSLAQFFGIEINDFAVAVAKTALWIAEAQMLRETAEILHREPDYLPLRDYANIAEGNALRMDWGRVGFPDPDIAVVSVSDHVPFKDAKAHLSELKDRKVEVLNAAGERFRFTKQIFKALSDKARDQSVARPVHWAAVAAVEKLCAASTFLWDEKPRNGSVDILRYAKHGVCFSFAGTPYVAKITSKVYPGDDANVTYSVEAVSVENNDARGITDSISKRQGLDPSAADRVLNFASAVKRAFAKNHFDYIMGNPPFSGARWMGKPQKDDMLSVFGKDWRGVGDLDYVTAWYKKAADMVGRVVLNAPPPPDAPRTRCAFVSTNSICQGGAVASLWKPLFAQGLEIDFAHRTFRWDNEAIASEKAHVHCVIVGFHAGGPGSVPAMAGTEPGPPKTIFDNGKAIPAAHINAYLIDAQDVWIEARRTAISAPLPLVFGSMPNDGGFLSNWSDERRAEILARHPAAEPLFRRIVGSHESINAISRWCLWLKGVSPAAIRAVPPVMEAVAKVRELRLASNRAATRKLAATPTLFGEIRQPENGKYLLIPKVSSERREYVPMSFMPADVIASDLCLIVPGATLCHFGVLTSSVHMAWMRTVAGRLKSDYRYSAAIVYNNFPWPEGHNGTNGTTGTDATGTTATVDGASHSSHQSHMSHDLCAAISSTAQAILDARANYPDASLADLYDPLTMPPDLRAAHAANDRAVLAAYGLAPDTPEPEIVARLFRLYAKLTERKA